jgi:hypothetical protein
MRWLTETARDVREAPLWVKLVLAVEALTCLLGIMASLLRFGP